MKLPEHVTGTWMASLGDADLPAGESELHTAFAAAEARSRGLHAWRRPIR